MQPDHSNGKTLESAEPAQVTWRSRFRDRWPSGLVALAVIVMSWFGLFLLWRGVSSLLGF